MARDKLKELRIESFEDFLKEYVPSDCRNKAKKELKSILETLK